MAISYIRLQFSDDGDSTGRLWVRAKSFGFLGEGAAYFSVEELREFAAQLSQFPIPSDDPISIAGGYGSIQADGSVCLSDERLGISVKVLDASRGYISVQIRVKQDWDRPGMESSATVVLVTTYQPLAKLAMDLAALVAGRVNEATLEGGLYQT